jgi:sensor domain CHASE-containing protein
MQYNTALCFMLAGGALLAYLRGRLRLAVPLLGAMVMVIGLLTMGEYIFGRDLGLDQLLFRSYLVERISHAGRMSPASCSCFTLVGLALIVARARRWRSSMPVVGALSSVVMSIGLMAVLGYAFNLPGTYGWGQLTQVALHTAAGFVLLGAGIFTLAWDGGRRVGERTPRWLPVPLAFGGCTATLVLYFALDRAQDEQIGRTVHSAVESVQTQVALRMDGRLRSLARMAQKWEFSGRPEQAAWEADAANYVRDLPDIQAIQWIDASRHIRWIEPLKENEGKLGLDLIEEPYRHAAAERARAEGKAIMSHSVPLFRGGVGFVIYVPVTNAGAFDGWLAVTIQAQQLFERYFPAAVIPGEALRFIEDGRVLGERAASTPAAKEVWVDEGKVDLPGATWTIRAWPTPELARQIDDPLPEIVLFAGMFGSVLLATICALAQRSSRLATETTEANAALRSALDQVKTLEGLLPICASCKRVRDDAGHWSQIESYVSRRTRASFSHGYCPECAAKAFTEFGLEVPDRLKEEIAQGNFD